MIQNFLLIILISSIFQLKYVLVPSRFLNLASFLVSVISIFWWANIFSPITDLYQKEIILTLYPLVPSFLFLVLYEKLTDSTPGQRIGYFIFFTASFLVLFSNFLMILFLDVSILPLMALIIGDAILFGMSLILLYQNSGAIVMPQISFSIRTEMLLHLVAGFYLFQTIYMITDHYSHYMALIFLSVYLTIFFPFLIRFPIRTFRLYLQSIIFSIFIFGLGLAYEALNTGAHFSNSSWQTNIIFACSVPILFLSLLKLFNLFCRFLDLLYPFSIIKQRYYTKCIEELNSRVSHQDIKTILSTSTIFRSSNHQLFTWLFHQGKLRAYTIDTPSLHSDLVAFMQYRDTIFFHELDELRMLYFDTPFQQNIINLVNFMKQYNISQLMLMQQAHEIIGFMAVACKGRRKEVLDSDTHRIKRFADIISNTVCNTNSIHQIINHQSMMEQINSSISKFNVTDSLKDVIQLTRRTMIQVMPEIKFYLFLNYDPTSGFYKCSNDFNFNMDDINFKIHSNLVRDHLKENISCKFMLNDVSTPAELQAIMLLINVNQALFIRVNDSEDSSIIILFFEKTIDLMDYRIPFCQIFLRQFEVFTQYQSNFEQLIDLQTFLKGLLDQLPTGIMVVNSKNEIEYLNSKIQSQLSYSSTIQLPQPIENTDLDMSITKAIEHVQSNRTEYMEKILISKNGQMELYLLSSFVIFQKNELSTIVVLTNIQQSKELIDQMNQTNRLAMMSKIAKGISYELITPVDQLIKGVSKLESDWANLQFQDYFVTAVVPQVDRINLLCQSLLRLSRSNTESLIEVYLPDLLDQVLRLIAGDLRYSNHKFYVVHIDREWIVIDQVMAIQVLMNLMIFSINSMAQEHSRLSLEIRSGSLEKLFIKIGVRHFKNLGQMSDDELKDQLELSIVNQIVVNQNGTFDVYSESSMIYFEILLPIKHVAALVDDLESS